MRMAAPSRGQRFLLPPSVDEFVGPRHPVRVIVDVVARLDLSAFDVGAGEVGRPAYPPDALISLLLYAFSQGVLSSREIARRSEVDCAFMYAAACLRPSYRTISRFRDDYKKALAEIFAQVVVICRKAGLGSTAVVAIDSTPQRANASMDAHSRRSQLDEELKKARIKFATLAEQAAATDAREDKQPGGDDDGSGGMPAHLADAKARIGAIEQALAELGEHEERNTTDSEARLQRFKEGSRPGYRIQLATSEKDGLILATDVHADAGDTAHLIPMIDAIRANTGATCGVVLADAGYESGENMKSLVDRDQDAIVAPAATKAAAVLRERTGKFQWTDFEHDPIHDEYICPAGQRLVYIGTKGPGRAYTTSACGSCTVRSRCTIKAQRLLVVQPTTPYLQAMSERRKFDREHGRLYRRRAPAIEGHFGHWKQNLRWRQFTRRGVGACLAEARILCSALNLKKLATHLFAMAVTPNTCAA
jgi:transposase